MEGCGLVWVGVEMGVVHTAWLPFGSIGRGEVGEVYG